MIQWTTITDHTNEFTWDFSVFANIGLTLTQDLRIRLLASPGDNGYLRITNSIQKLTGANFSIEDCSSPTVQTSLYFVMMDDERNIHATRLDPVVTPRSQAATFRLEAENMALQNFSIVSGQAFASNTKFITGTQAVDGSSLATATYTFAGQPGEYTIHVGYFDENDGQTTANLLRNDQPIMTWVWSEATSSGNATAATARVKQSEIFRFVPGDVIKYTVTRQAGENGRTDYLLFEAVTF